MVSGPAGSGKTMLAYELAKRIAASGEEVWFFCSPKMLRKYLSAVARNRMEVGPEARRVFFTIPQAYAMRYIDSVVNPGNYHEYPTKSGRAAEEIMLKALNEKELAIPNVVIDEGQDFSDAWIEGLRKCTTGRFFVFYDRNQALFQPELASWLRQAECRLVLKKICRNTREIAATAFRIIDGAALHCDAPSGPKPILHIHSGPVQLHRILRRILDGYLSKKGIEPKDIAVLTVETQRSSGVARFDWPVASSDDIYLNAVCFTSAARFKGMERRIVIVVDVDFGQIRDGRCRQKLHLGCSRAIHELHIIAIEPSADDLRTAIEVLGGQMTQNPSLRDLGDLLSVDLRNESVLTPLSSSADPAKGPIGSEVIEHRITKLCVCRFALWFPAADFQEHIKVRSPMMGKRRKNNILAVMLFQNAFQGF